MNLLKLCLSVLLCLAVWPVLSIADTGGHSVAHTHIGINPSWQPDWSDPGNSALAVDTDSTDDNQLWFFSVPPVHPVAATPGWPNWGVSGETPFLHLTPVLEADEVILKGDGSGKMLWTCDFLYSQDGGYGDAAGYDHLDGWHSAFGPQGVWNLDGGTIDQAPGWAIYLKRESTSVEESDFMALLPDDTAVLTSDGSEVLLEQEWLADEGAWGIHEHMGFYFWLTPEVGQEVSVTFTAYDGSGLYAASDPYTMNFVTVPEPATLGLIITGIAFLRKRNNPCFKVNRL